MLNKVKALEFFTPSSKNVFTLLLAVLESSKSLALDQLLSYLCMRYIAVSRNALLISNLRKKSSDVFVRVKYTRKYIRLYERK